jgi:multidrug efflux pump subunit AcrB
VVIKEGWHGLDLGKALEVEVKKITRELPLDVTFSKINDQAVNIREAVDEFMLKFFVAFLVVMVVILVSLGWRVGVVVAAAVPLTLAALFVMMLLTGWRFDRISLGAMILALGLLVDDAITQVREDIRTVDVVARTSGSERLDPARLADFTLTSQDGHLIPLGRLVASRSV